MRLTEDRIERAAKQAFQQELSSIVLDDGREWVSEKLIRHMKQLSEDIENGKVKASKVYWGWHYYMRNVAVAAAISIIFVCVTMPEQVMAGCQTVIRFVETVFQEYTQFEFSTDTEDNSEFEELTFGYLPENTHDFRIEEEEGIERRYIFEVGDSKLFILCQEKLIKEMKETYIVDTENSEQKMVIVQGDSVRLIKKGEQIQYIWLRGNYKITGLSNLSQEELINILEHIQ